MTNKKLHHIIKSVSNTVEGTEGNWKFSIDTITFYCLTDTLHNRMRIIAPITEISNCTEKEINECMKANFHSALDIRYAISDEIIWSAFIHPLKELTKNQVIDGISQVYSGVKTFGTHYSSGALSFLTEEERKSRLN